MQLTHNLPLWCQVPARRYDHTVDVFSLAVLAVEIVARGVNVPGVGPPSARMDVVAAACGRASSDDLVSLGLRLLSESIDPCAQALSALLHRCLRSQCASQRPGFEESVCCRGKCTTVCGAMRCCLVMGCGRLSSAELLEQLMGLPMWTESTGAVYSSALRCVWSRASQLRVFACSCRYCRDCCRRSLIHPNPCFCVAS